MMEFIILTLGITVGMLLAMATACIIMLQPKVVNWYMKKMFKAMNQGEEAFMELYTEAESK